MLHLVHRSKGRCSCRNSLLISNETNTVQQTTLNIRKPIRPNSSSLYATASLEPLQTISRGARRRTRLGLLRFVRVHGALSLRSVCMCARCISACWPLFSVRVHGKQGSFFRYIVYRTIVVSLSVHMCTVRNTNLWLNLRACARNVSPCMRYSLFKIQGGSNETTPVYISACNK